MSLQLRISREVNFRSLGDLATSSNLRYDDGGFFDSITPSPRRSIVSRCARPHLFREAMSLFHAHQRTRAGGLHVDEHIWVCAFATWAEESENLPP